MAILTDRQSVPANATVQNVLAGKLNEFLSENSICSLYATASAVGMNISFIVASEVVVDDQEINAQNRMPLVPDDFIGNGGGFQGDRVIIRLRNTTAGAITAFTRLETNPA
jgi:hypothetical protein